MVRAFGMNPKVGGSSPPQHDDVIKWRHFPRYWPFVRGIHRSPVNSSHKGQWRGALMLSLICAQINGRVNNGEAGDLRRYRAHCDVIVMGRDIFCLKNFDTFTRTFVRVSKMNAVVFQMLALLQKYPFINFNGATFEVWEWISNFIPHFTGHVITYPCWDWN